mgnify:CR=1 FL=1
MQFGRVRKISPVGLQNTQRKILQNFLKLHMNSGKIAVARDKICSSLDKIARDNRQNFVKISRLALSSPLPLSHTRRIHRLRKRRRRFGF